MQTDIKSFLSNSQRWDISSYSLDQCKEAIMLLERRIKQLTNADYQSWLEKQITDLGLSTRATSVLASAKLYTIGDLLQYGIDKVGLLRGCGEFTAKEIKEVALRDMPQSC